MGSSRLKSRRRQDLGSKWARVVIAVLSTVGVIDTGSITLNKWGFIGNLNCPGGHKFSKAFVLLFLVIFN